MARKTLMSINIPVGHKEDLAKLSKETRVPIAAYVREGIEYVLEKYGYTKPIKEEKEGE